MRIILINKFFYNRGGDCIYMLNLRQILIEHGHEVAVFAMNYPLNIDTPWKKYFPQYMTMPMVFTRPFGSKEVKTKFTNLLDDFKPDVIHCNNIHTQLSPIILKIAHKKGIRIVWTLHDSKLVCPCYTCMRKGKWCTDCFNDKSSVIKYKCMKGGLLGSIIGYYEAKKWNVEKLQEYTDLFIAPSQFMANTCIAGGYQKEKFKVLSNFIDINKVMNPIFEKENYYVFLGRLTEVKGIRTLCKAAKDLPYELIIIGGGELKDELIKQYKECSNIKFIGQKEWNSFRPILEKARFMVIPSEWSENNPLTIIEAQSLGTPVLGARIGGIPELIEENVSGMTFESGNVEDLKNKIKQMFNTKFEYRTLAHNSVEKYSSESYYKQIMELYKG